MRVMAVNGSPRMGKGATAAILNPFLEGMAQAGAETTLLYASEMSINPCQGCFACSTKGTGICWQQDDLADIYEDIINADLLVLASPVYVSGPTGPLKTFIDRLLTPLGEPSLSLFDGHCHHNMRAGVNRGRVFLISACAYWEMDNFDLLLAQIEAFCGHAEREFAGSLLRPPAPAFQAMLEGGGAAADVVAAAKEAGVQFVSRGAIREDVRASVSQPLLPLEAYVRVADG